MRYERKPPVYSLSCLKEFSRFPKSCPLKVLKEKILHFAPGKFPDTTSLRQIWLKFGHQLWLKAFLFNVMCKDVPPFPSRGPSISEIVFKLLSYSGLPGGVRKLFECSRQNPNKFPREAQNLVLKSRGFGKGYSPEMFFFTKLQTVF